MELTKNKVTPNDPQFLRLETLLDAGNIPAALNLWNESMNEEFESGVQYASENIGDNHREN